MFNQASVKKKNKKKNCLTGFVLYIEPININENVQVLMV